jgi:hypothetical protein
MQIEMRWWLIFKLGCVRTFGYVRFGCYNVSICLRQFCIAATR